MKLVNPSDKELNVAFAEYVARWSKDTIARIEWNPSGAFTVSVDAIMPWLDLHPWSSNSARDGQYGVYINWPERDGGKSEMGGDVLITLTKAYGESSTFAKAGVIALLKLNGIEVEFTK